MVKIGVLGAGSWGLGLAMLLHNNGHDVTVWSVFPDEINELNATRENKKCLPGVIFPESVKFCADTEKVVTESDVLILAVASPYTRSTAKIVAPYVKEGQYIVNVGKGIEEESLKTLCEVTKEEIPRAVSGSRRGRAHLGFSPQAGLQGGDRDHQHGPADRSRHEPELCARGG